MIYVTKIHGKIRVMDTRTLGYYSNIEGCFITITRTEAARFLKMWREFGITITREGR